MENANSSDISANSITESNESLKANQINELENQIKNLETHKKLLEKSVSTSTIVVVSIGVFLCFFTLIGTYLSSGLGFSSSDTIQSFFLAIVPTIITVMIVVDNGKKKDREALEQRENKIQELKEKIKSVK